MAGSLIPQRALLGICSILLIGYGCKKTTGPVNSSVTLEISHEVDGIPLQADTLIYQNDAGNTYSVTRLEYYLSYFNFVNDAGQAQRMETVLYVNGLHSSTLKIETELKTGTYNSLQFFIGLPPEENISYHLDPTPENINMVWPEMMGGGYHFMKFEGHYLDPAQEEKGFAMHLGMNQWLVTVMLNQPIQIIKEAHTLHLTMNLNEWFSNPHLYNFDLQGNYTMGVDSLMQKLSENGTSVFTLHQEP